MLLGLGCLRGSCGGSFHVNIRSLPGLLIFVVREGEAKHVGKLWVVELALKAVWTKPGWDGSRVGEGHGAGAALALVLEGNVVAV